MAKKIIPIFILAALAALCLTGGEAVPADSGAEVAIMVGYTAVENGKAATWQTGVNTLTVQVTNGGKSKTYTVTVTKGE